MTARLLVTGGAGYVGSHAVKHLLVAGHDVTVLDNLSRGHRDAVLGAELLEADLLDATRLREILQPGRFDAVLHFAAYCYVGESVSNPRAYYRNNVVGSLNLVEAMLDAGTRRLVFSSTCATYGHPQSAVLTEAHPQQPINPYGATKLAVERMLRDVAGAHGLASVSLRYFNAAGCDPDGALGERHEPETHLIPLVLAEALRVARGGDPAATELIVNGDDYDTADGTCIRDYVHVCDLASAHAAAAIGLIDGRLAGANAYNLGTGRGFSVREVIDACGRVTGTAIRYRVGSRRPGDPARLVADSRAAQSALGWRAQYRQLDAIVETAWRWLERHSP